MSIDAARSPAEAPDQDTGLPKGATIGRYVVLGLLGRGGMGEVYAAYDPELDRKIAIKLLRARGGHDAEAAAQGRTRLLREAQAIARLSHPNVVVVYDVGTFRGVVFIAMEFVEGNTVGYWLNASPRRWREVLDVFMAAGRGLVAAHDAGIVHRDFKPENVMITRDGQLRVMDFGLARQVLGEDEPPPSEGGAADAVAAALLATLDGELDPDATANLERGSGERRPTSSGGYLGVKLTQTGAVLGTPAYMAPEQFGGRQGDARADQFSFCVALYEGLYGRRPFEGGNIVTLMASVVGGIVGAAPPEARVPAWIRKVLLRGLRVDPDERFPSMAALLAALGQDPAVRRRRFVATATGALLIVTAAVGAQRLSAGQRAVCAGAPGRIAAVWGPTQREAVRRAFTAAGKTRATQVFTGVASLLDQYVARWSAIYGEACQATHVRGEQSAEVLDLRMGCLGERLGSARALVDVFSQADERVLENAVSAASSLPQLDRCSDVAMLRAVVKPPDDPAVRARVAALRDDVAKVEALGKSGHCERAVEAGRAAADAAAKLGYLPVKAEAFYQLGRLGEYCTDSPSAVAALEESTLAAEGSHHDEIAVVASVYLAFQHALRVHDARLARYWVRHGEAILARFPGHPLLEAWIAGAQANVLQAEGDWEGSLEAERRALALKEAALGKVHVDDAVSLMNQAEELHQLGREAEGEPIIARAIDIFTKLVGPDATWLASALLDQCEALTVLHRYDAAHVAIERAIGIWKRRGAGAFYTGYGLLDLGRLQLAEGHAQAALATLQQAVALLGTSDVQIAAEAQFEIARALWESRTDRPTALTTAARASETMRGVPMQARKRAEIDAWLRARPPG